MIEQFYLTHREDPNKYYHTRIEEDLGVMAIYKYYTFS